MFPRFLSLLAITAMWALLSGCTSSQAPDTPSTPVDGAATNAEGSTETPAEDAQSSASAAETTSEAAATVPTSTGDVPSELNAAHILIMHKDSARVPPDVTRTREEALALAQQIATEAQAEGADFAALAQQHSEGPSGPNGGNLGNFAPEQMVPPFSQAAVQLGIGEVSDPVETSFGFHIIRRQELIPSASAKHILVMYQGSMRAPEEITRTKEEAEARIRECLARVQKGEAFEDLAREYSDGPTGPNGGDLGKFPQGVMAPAFDKATFECEVGKVTDVVETPFGYHIIYRYE